jgi:hypothetical protein
MATNNDPQQINQAITALRNDVESSRRRLLGSLGADARDEAEAYRQRRDALAQIAPNDPRLAILDARILGALAIVELGDRGGDSRSVPTKGGTDKSRTATATKTSKAPVEKPAAKKAAAKKPVAGKPAAKPAKK